MSIGTWDELLGSSLPADTERLMLYTAYILVARGAGGRLLALGRVQFVCGPSRLAQPLPPQYNQGTPPLVVGEPVVSIRQSNTGQQGVGWGAVVPRAALIFGLTCPDYTFNPLARMQEYACVPTGSRQQLVFHNGEATTA